MPGVLRARRSSSPLARGIGVPALDLPASIYAPRWHIPEHGREGVVVPLLHAHHIHVLGVPPARPPRFRYGSIKRCSLRGDVRIVGLNNGRIPWAAKPGRGHLANSGRAADWSFSICGSELVSALTGVLIAVPKTRIRPKPRLSNLRPASMRSATPPTSTGPIKLVNTQRPSAAPPWHYLQALWGVLKRSSMTPGKLSALRERVLDEAVLWQTIEPRYQALLRSGRAREAWTRHEVFLACSPGYRACIDRGDGRLADVPHDTTMAAGLIWHVPADGRLEGRFSHRILTRGWLPLAEVLQARELAVGTAMIDLGANIGTTSITRVVLGDFQVVYAAEPEPNNYSCLVQNVVANDLRGFVLPDRLAIGSYDGDAFLKLSNSSIGGHELAKDPKDDPGRRFVCVPCRTLDSWVAGLGIDLDMVTFVKCDAQGWEGHILRGATEVLRHRHIAWQIEFWPHGLRKAGFEVPEVLALIHRHFTHMINLRPLGDGIRVRPVSDLPKIVKKLPGKKFTELLLYNGAAG
jgi:FkbM family methyltransferase